MFLLLQLSSILIILILEINGFLLTKKMVLEEFWEPGSTSLDLYSIDIDSIEPGAFSGLTTMKRLDLSHNILVELNPNTFEGLANLTKLNIGNFFSMFKCLSRIEVSKDR